MDIIIPLIFLPMLAALVLLILRQGKARTAVVWSTVIALCAGAIFLLVRHGSVETTRFQFILANLNSFILIPEALLVIYFIWVGIRRKRYWIPVLALAQAAVLVLVEFSGLIAHGETDGSNLFAVDYLSLIMALIVAVIGGLVCVYALGYMKEHQEHSEKKDKSKRFFAVLFIFLGAMFGIVFADNLVLMYFFWEVTTFASFWLIGYSETEEARKNAFRALTFNLLGGLAFALAIGWMAWQHGTVELSALFAMGKSFAVIPAALLALAGCTKAAQFPFSSWLTGAMVAPTPVSALLHSSTMVKAGVYLVIRLAPVLGGTRSGFLVALIGGITFLFAAILALSQSDAKKVLAYSTISNLGLIVLCAAVGTAESVWAAILLLVFHAVAKALLFMCVGTIEHRIGSRSIEDMHGLIRRMPRVTILVLIGIAGMFLAPFGMLISKWAALRALVDANPLLAVIVAFGGAVTLFFWTKWMGRLTTTGTEKTVVEKDVSRSEWSALYPVALLTVALCAGFPLLSRFLIDPYLSRVFGTTLSMSAGNIAIMLVMMGLIFLLPVGMFVYYLASYRRKLDVVYTDVYLSGANLRKPFHFRGSMDIDRKVVTGNYTLTEFLPPEFLFRLACGACIAIMAGLVAFQVLGVV